MYIIIERHTNRHDNIYDAFIVRPVYYNSLEKAILKAKDLFEGVLVDDEVARKVYDKP